MPRARHSPPERGEIMSSSVCNPHIPRPFYPLSLPPSPPNSPTTSPVRPSFHCRSPLHNVHIEVERLRTVLLLLRRRALHAAVRLGGVEHEGEEAGKDGADGPHRVPRLGVEVAHREAQPLVRDEATVRGVHQNGRRLVRVVRGELQHAVVEPTCVRRVLRALDEVVPLEDVVLPRKSTDEVDRLLLQVEVLLRLEAEGGEGERRGERGEGWGCGVREVSVGPVR